MPLGMLLNQLQSVALHCFRARVGEALLYHGRRLSFKPAVDQSTPQLSMPTQLTTILREPLGKRDVFLRG